MKILNLPSSFIGISLTTCAVFTICFLPASSFAPPAWRHRAGHSNTWQPKRARENARYYSPPEYVFETAMDEPTCEELRAMWRMTKRAAEHNINTNTIPVEANPIVGGYGYVVKTPSILDVKPGRGSSNKGMVGTVVSGRPRHGGSFGTVVVQEPKAGQSGAAFDEVAKQLRKGNDDGGDGSMVYQQPKPVHVIKPTPSAPVFVSVPKYRPPQQSYKNKDFAAYQGKGQNLQSQGYDLQSQGYDLQSQDFDLPPQSYNGVVPGQEYLPQGFDGRMKNYNDRVKGLGIGAQNFNGRVQDFGVQGYGGSRGQGQGQGRSSNIRSWHQPLSSVGGGTQWYNSPTSRPTSYGNYEMIPRDMSSFSEASCAHVEFTSCRHDNDCDCANLYTCFKGRCTNKVINGKVKYNARIDESPNSSIWWSGPGPSQRNQIPYKSQPATRRKNLRRTDRKETVPKDRQLHDWS